MNFTLNISAKESNTIKGLACMLIVLHHYCGRLMGAGYSNFLIDLIALRGGVTGVAVFFFLSAYGLAESQQKHHYDFITFLKRRLLKIYVPLLITNVLYNTILLMVNDEYGFSIKTFFLRCVNIELSDGVTWFCNVIMVFYLCFYIAFVFNQKIVKVLVLSIFSLLYSLVCGVYYPEAPYLIYSIIGFPLGLTISLYKDDFKTKRLCILSIMTAAILLLGAMFFKKYSNLFVANMYSYMIIIISAVTLSHIKRQISFAGAYSHEIYLLHNKFLCLNGALGLTLWYPVTFLLLVLPCSILLKRTVTQINNAIIPNQNKIACQ